MELTGCLGSGLRGTPYSMIPFNHFGERWPRDATVVTNGMGRRYGRNLAILHITEAELARYVVAFMEKIKKGAEVVVEGDEKGRVPITSPRFHGRPMDE